MNIEARVRDAVVLSEGMLTAWDRAGRRGGAFTPSLAPVTATGGEVLRGHFAQLVPDGSDGAVCRNLLHRFAAAQARRLTVPARAAYMQDLGPWLRRTSAEGQPALEDYYVRQRASRRGGALVTAVSVGTTSVRPFFDNAVVHAARATPLPERTSERLMVATLMALSLPAARVPLSGFRWAFEVDGPSPDVDAAGYAGRSPVVGARGGSALHDWRQDYGTEATAELRRLVYGRALGHRRSGGGRAGSADYDGPQPSRGQSVWQIATVAVALSGALAAPDRPTPRARPVVVTPAPAVTPPERVGARARVGRRFPWLVGAVRRARGARR